MFYLAHYSCNINGQTLSSYRDDRVPIHVLIRAPLSCRCICLCGESSAYVFHDISASFAAMSKSIKQPGVATTTKNSVAQNSWTRRERPCDACRRRKSRCIISDQSEACVLCQSRSEECTFVQSPVRRKRPRVEVDGTSPESTTKVK